MVHTMRRQISDFEDRVSRQIHHLESQLVQGGGTQSALARLEGKVSSAESTVPKLDRRVAEVNGTVKGLSEEMQSQIRKVNGLEEWVFSAHQQLQTELGTKLVEFEQVVAKVASARRTTDAGGEDAFKRLALRIARLEQDAEARWSSNEETRGAVATICARLENVEDRCLALDSARLDFATPGEEARLTPTEPTVCEGGGSSAGGEALLANGGTNALAAMQHRLDDVVERTERVFEDMHDVHARVAEQKVEVGTLRTLFDSRVEHIKQLGEKLSRTNVLESKMQNLQTAVEDALGRGEAQQGEIEALAQRLSGQDGEERLDSCTAARLGEEASACRALEARIDGLQEEVGHIREDACITPQVTVLVSQLKELVPQVVGHDQRLKDLAERTKDDREHDVEVLSSRISGLEDSVSELSAKASSAVEQAEKVSEQQLLAAGTLGFEFKELRESTTAEVKSMREQLEQQASAAAERANEASGEAGAGGADAKALVEVQGRLSKIEEEDEARRKLSDQLDASVSRLGNDLEATKTSCEGSIQGYAETLSLLRSDVQELREAASATTADVVAAAPAPAADIATRAELAVLRDSVASVAESVVTLRCAQMQNELEGTIGLIREGVARVSDQSEKTVQTVRTLQDTHADLHALRSDVKASEAGATIGGDGELAVTLRAELGSLRDEVAAISARLEAAPPTASASADAAAAASGGGGEAAERLLQLAELASEAKEEDAKEEAAHRQLLARIDELCERLAEVDAAVASNGGKESGDSLGSDAEFRRRFEGLASQVDALRVTERQLQAKFEIFFSQFKEQLQEHSSETLSPPSGRGSARPMASE